MKELWEQINENLRALEVRCELEEGILDDFVKDGDDWMVTLRISSMIEMVLKTGIYKRMMDDLTSDDWRGLGAIPEIHLHARRSYSASTLENMISKMNVHGSFSLVKYSKMLKLIDPLDVKFITSVSDIRNNYAHSLVSHRRTFSQMMHHISGGDQKKIKNFIEKISYGKYSDNPDLTKVNITALQFGAMMFLVKMAIVLMPPQLETEGLLSGPLVAEDEEND